MVLSKPCSRDTLPKFIILAGLEIAFKDSVAVESTVHHAFGLAVNEMLGIIFSPTRRIESSTAIIPRIPFALVPAIVLGLVPISQRFVTLKRKSLVRFPFTCKLKGYPAGLFIIAPLFTKSPFTRIVFEYAYLLNSVSMMVTVSLKTFPDIDKTFPSSV